MSKRKKVLKSSPCVPKKKKKEEKDNVIQQVKWDEEEEDFQISLMKFLETTRLCPEDICQLDLSLTEEDEKKEMVSQQRIASKQERVGYTDGVFEVLFFLCLRNPLLWRSWRSITSSYIPFLNYC